MEPQPPDAAFAQLPAPIALLASWQLETDREAGIGHTIRDASLEAIGVDEAREGVVTLEVTGNLGAGFQAYELDVTPSGADELALWLIRRAVEARAEIRQLRRERGA